MAGNLMRDGLSSPMGQDESALFALIDSTGGWPVGYRYVGFEHTSERAAGFNNSPRNDGWWTVLADADDYYMWKLSPQAMQRIVDAVVSSIRLPRVDESRLSIKISRGYKAARATQPLPPPNEE